MTHDTDSRRRFLERAAGVGAAAGLGVGLGLGVRRTLQRPRAGATNEHDDPRAEAWVEVADTPIEDLMREHAVLERILLVYEECARRLDASEDFAPETLGTAGRIVRRYIEDHHERDEEEHVFPRLESIDAERDLIATLRAQHAAGRRLTTEVIERATQASARDPRGRPSLALAVRRFVRMYRPHAAQENTVLFPAFRRSISQKEYHALRLTLERSERASFGDRLYEEVLGEVRGLERALGIGELAAFTPP